MQAGRILYPCIVLIFYCKNDIITRKIKTKNMNNQDFQKELQKYQAYLKPELFKVLTEKGEFFPDGARDVVIEKLKEAETQMQELAAYQQERVEIRKKGLENIEGIYEKTKEKYQEMVSTKEGAEKEDAEKLLHNL